jgi:hypothetical protein
LISALTYLPVPIVLFVMALLKPLTSPLTLLIPVFILLAVASACVFEIQLFLSTVTKGKISALIHDLKKLVIGITTLLIPLAAYSITYLVSFSHILAVLILGMVSTLELAMAIYLIRQNKK